MRIFKKLLKYFRLVVLCFPFTVFAQTNLLEEINDEALPVYALSTFKGTRLGNGHTVETSQRGSLDFIFSHRFGAISGGAYEFFGLDQAFVRIGLDYGITDRLTVGLGRNSFDKTMDGFAKYKLLHQQSGSKSIPVSITALGGAAYKLSPKDNADVSPTFTNADRISYTAQLLVTRKFSPGLSLQVMPTLVHKNFVNQNMEQNTQVALGLGGRVKVSRSMALTAEYYYNASKKENSPYANSFAIGLDIETGGHVFQLLFTNAIGLNERGFITETLDRFFDGDIHFGFNISRNFQLLKNR